MTNQTAAWQEFFGIVRQGVSHFLSISPQHLRIDQEGFFRRKIEKGFALVQRLSCRSIKSPPALARGCSRSTDLICPFLLGNNWIIACREGYEGQHLGNQHLDQEQRMFPVQKPSWVWKEEIRLPNIPRKIKNIWWPSGISSAITPGILR